MLRSLESNEQIRFSVLGKLHVGTVMVLCCFVFRFWGGFKLFYKPLLASLNIVTLDVRDLSASLKWKVFFVSFKS